MHLPIGIPLEFTLSASKRIVPRPVDCANATGIENREQPRCRSRLVDSARSSTEGKASKWTVKLN